MVRLHDIMTVDPLTIDPQATLREAAELLAAEHVSGLPVVSGSKLVGVISATDLLHFDADRPTSARGHEEAGASDWTLGEDMGLETRGLEAAADEDDPDAAYFTDLGDEGASDLYERFGLSREGNGGRHDLDDVRVGEIMTREVLTLPPETEAGEAARRMLRADVHRVLVVEGEKLLGVVSTTDMMKAVAQHGLAG
jgi:CBS domain-containing protein